MANVRIEMMHQLAAWWQKRRVDADVKADGFDPCAPAYWKVAARHVDAYNAIYGMQEERAERTCARILNEAFDPNAPMISRDGAERRGIIRAATAEEIAAQRRSEDRRILGQMAARAFSKTAYLPGAMNYVPLGARLALIGN